ncbi:DUF6482 family protein [Glaciecola sp.]|jgi:hypothetical protein|uniref:DUF6482 family protein n=1 Tax=Glaciecola sp. MF2-115 TaxID=3384827 RepID=UPI003988DA61
MTVKFPMTMLATKPQQIKRLEVQSFEMSVYLVKITIEGRTGFVTDHNDSPMRFFSTQMIKDMFSHCEVEVAVMTQDSVYEEMIGNPIVERKAPEIPFSMAQPY